jgi:hypothetical protein
MAVHRAITTTMAAPEFQAGTRVRAMWSSRTSPTMAKSAPVDIAAEGEILGKVDAFGHR